jgi:adenine specific DNA methylase Mod
MDGEKSEKSELDWHLNKYTTKNTSDYFIHKDLKKFLTQELDFYIKNEILHIDDIISKEDFNINLNKVKVFKQISLKIIDLYVGEFPHLYVNKDFILKELKNEEKKFSETIVKGLAIFNKVIDILFVVVNKFLSYSIINFEKE